MNTENLDADLLRKCFIAGAENLRINREYINELNVFPVPDGDTGTNMTMTISSAAEAVSALGDGADMQSVCGEITGGSLRGARGNSGVILSQLLRGLCKVLKEHDEADAKLIAEAFRKAADTAYKAVMKPKEGTILTVARAMADAAENAVGEEMTDLAGFTESVVRCGNEALQKTPELLPVLKEAGVVDSGGKGLMCIMEGVLAVLEGRETEPAFTGETSGTYVPESTGQGGRKTISTDDIRFGYCTEFMVNSTEAVPDEKVAELRSFLETIGDSIVCVHDEGIVKVHVHTNHPGQAFEKGLELGPLTRMKVDNMREEHEEKLIKDASRIAAREAAEKEPEKPVVQEHKETGFVSICSGEGLRQIFTDLGVSYVIEGGQTMNPSTEDILEAVKTVNADTVFVLPNNKNIILAAEQAAAINKDVNIIVVPTLNIPQGITAMINYCVGLSDSENLEGMKEGIACVRTAQVTYAVRNTSIEGEDIKAGDIMGIGDRGLLAVGQDLNATALETALKLTDGTSELITVYYGDGVDPESAGKLCDALRNRLPEVEVDLQNGGQPVYYYIISAE